MIFIRRMKTYKMHSMNVNFTFWMKIQMDRKIFKLVFGTFTTFFVSYLLYCITFRWCRSGSNCLRHEIFIIIFYIVTLSISGSRASIRISNGIQYILLLFDKHLTSAIALEITAYDVFAIEINIQLVFNNQLNWFCLRESAFHYRFKLKLFFKRITSIGWIFGRIIEITVYSQRTITKYL